MSCQECCLCGYLTPDLKSHIGHLRLVHKDDPSFSISCGLGGCSERFTNFAAYSTHIYRKHRGELGLQRAIPTSAIDLQPEITVQRSTDSITDNESLEVEIGCQDVGCAEQYCTEEDSGIFCNSTFNDDQTIETNTESNAKMLLELSEGRKLSEVSIQDVISGCRNVCTQVQSQIKDTIYQTLCERDVDSAVIDDVMEAITDSYQDPFMNLSSPYLREKYYKEHFPYLEGKEVLLGEPYYTDQFQGTKRRKVEKCDKFYYVPLLELLALLIKNKSIFDEVTAPHFSPDPSKLRDFCDGSMFKEHQLFSTDSNALQIIAYYDEVEITNALGSYVRTHKLGALFFSLGNFRPHLRSTLKSIFVLAIGRVEDIKEYGMDAFLSPFVDDLNTLYLDWISVVVDSQRYVFHGALIAFLADNLAAHNVGGFKESFSWAKRICRSCMATTSSIQTSYCEDDCELRTAIEHERQCMLLWSDDNPQNISKEYGINRRSILENVAGFSVANGIPQDIMHDLFEGVVATELQLFLTHCINSRFFPIALLNSRITRHDFPCNRPSPIESTSKIRQSASQMMTLITELPIIIGDKIPHDDKRWKSLLILIKICKIALAPTCTKDMVCYLRHLIEEKLASFKILYPEANITPKMHYMLHYPSQILRHGPLLRSWCMRHESKLSFVKQCSIRGNFKNVCKTAINKHQRWLCYQLKYNSNLVSPNIELGPIKSDSSLSTEPEHIREQILQLVPDLSITSTVYHPKWLQINSIVLKPDAFLLLKYDDMSPSFGKIREVLTFDDCTTETVIVSVQAYTSEYYENHYDSFVVRPSGKVLLASFGSLDYHQTLCARNSFDTSDHNLYISLPCTY